MAMGLGEAYSILGQATTSEYERRRREEERRRRRERRQDILGFFLKPVAQEISAGIGKAISSPFEKKYQDFFNSEVAVAAKAKDAQGRGILQEYEGKEKAARDFSGGYNKYWGNRGQQEVLQGLIAANPDREEEFKSPYFQAYLQEQGKAVGDELRRRHEEGLKLARSFGASGTLSDNLRNMRSRGLFDRVVDIFQGESVEEQDAKAEKAFRDSTYLTNRDRLLVFDESIREGKTKYEAYQTAIDNVPEKGGYYDPFTVTRNETTTDEFGNKKTTTYTETYQRGTQQWKLNKPTDVRKDTTIDLSEEGEKRLTQQILNAANQQFNYVVQARKIFTTEAYDSFKEEVEAEGISLTNIQNVEERLRVGEIFDKYDTAENMASEDIRRERAAARRSEGLTRIMEKDIAFDIALRNKLKDPTNQEFQDAYENELARVHNIYADSLLDLANKTTPPTSTTTSPTTTTTTPTVESVTDPATGVRHSRPSGMSDEDWENYKKAMGVS